MRKLILINLFIFVIISYEKESFNDSSTSSQPTEFDSNNSGNRSAGSNDTYLCEAISSSELDCYEKGALLQPKIIENRRSVAYTYIGVKEDETLLFTILADEKLRQATLTIVPLKFMN